MYNYFLIIFDDATSHSWTVNLKQKSNADPAIWQFIAMVKTQYGLSIKEVQIDAGGKFKSQEFTVFLQELGINILTSVPHMHQQNGRAERFIRTVVDKVQAMHLDACLPHNWWEFAVDCTTHVYNHTPIQRHDWKMPFENLKRIKPDVAHLHVFGCGTYVFLPEEVRVNKLNPKSELMTFLGYPQGTKGYLFIREPNNVLFTAVQALFDKTLFPKCPDMHHPGYTPVAPVNAQGEYNIPLEDNENGDDGGAPFGPAPPGRHVPYQAPPPLPPRNQGKGKNPNPPVPLELTLPGSTPSESSSDKFYAPKTPSWRSPLRDDPDSLHRFFDPNSSHFDLYDKRTIFYENQNDPSTLSWIRYDYMRHGRQSSWEWQNPATGAPDPRLGWSCHADCGQIPDCVFEDFLRHQDQRLCQTSPTPARPRQPANPLVNPPRCSGQQRQPIHWPDNVYRDEAPVDILQNYDAFDVSRPLSDQSPDQQEGLSGHMGSNDLTSVDNITANISWEGGAKLIYNLLSATIQPSDEAGGDLPSVSNVCEWQY